MKNLGLQELGTLVDDADELMVALLAYRRMLTLRIGALKAEKGLDLFRPEVEKCRLEKAKELARKIRMDPEFASSILYTIMRNSLRQQIIQVDGRRGDDEPPGVNEAELYPVLREALICLLASVGP